MTNALSRATRASWPRTGALMSMITVAIALGGCAGASEPTAALSAEELSEAPRASVAEWQSAPSGCEDVRGTFTLAVAETEPTLGALLDEHGEARCVDALDVLRVELRLVTVRAAMWPLTPVSSGEDDEEEGDEPDPEPEPMLRPLTPVIRLGGGRRGDPEPEPMTGS